MMRYHNVNLLVFAGVLMFAALQVAGNQCQCGGFVVNSETKAKVQFYTYPKTFGGKCNEPKPCAKACADYLDSFYGANYNLNTPYNGVSLGNWICQRVNSAPAKSFVWFQSKVCDYQWWYVKIIYNIQCSNGKYVP